MLDAVLTVWPAGRVGVRLAPNGVYGSMGSPDNHAMFLYLARRLGSYRLAYLHLMDGLGFGFHNLCPPVTLHDFRREYGAENALVGNVECTRDMAEGAIRSVVVLVRVVLGPSRLTNKQQMYINTLKSPPPPRSFHNNPLKSITGRAPSTPSPSGAPTSPTRISWSASLGICPSRRTRP